MRFKLLLPAVVLCFLATPLLAEVTTNIELTRKLIQTQKKIAIADIMELDEETAQKFWPIYNDYQNELLKAKDSSVKIIRDLVENFEDLSNEKAKKILDEFLKSEGDILKVKKKYVKIFRKSLSNKMVAQYFQAENKIEAIISYGLAIEIPLIQ